MSFPLIRPEDAARMPAATRTLLLRALREECREAGARHRRILTERAARQQAERAAERARLAELRADRGFTEEERAEAERTLLARRLLVQAGRRQGDGSRDDDLQAAHAAVRAGSTNGYLVALDREYWRTRRASQRRAHRAHEAHRAARACAPTTDRRTA